MSLEAPPCIFIGRGIRRRERRGVSKKRSGLRRERRDEEGPENVLNVGEEKGGRRESEIKEDERKVLRRRRRVEAGKKGERGRWFREEERGN